MSHSEKSCCYYYKYYYYELGIYTYLIILFQINCTVCILLQNGLIIRYDSIRNKTIFLAGYRIKNKMFC